MTTAVPQTMLDRFRADGGLERLFSLHTKHRAVDFAMAAQTRDALRFQLVPGRKELRNEYNGEQIPGEFRRKFNPQQHAGRGSNAGGESR